MANIIELKNKKTGVKQYPITKSQAVYGSDGNTVSQKLVTDEADIASLKEQVSGFTKLSEGSTTGDAELINTRTTWYGTTETSAGNAVRNQAENLILTQSGKPTGNALKGNKVWIKPSQDDIEIPDMDDFNGLKDDFNPVKQPIYNSIDYSKNLFCIHPTYINNEYKGIIITRKDDGFGFIVNGTCTENINIPVTGDIDLGTRIPAGTYTFKLSEMSGFSTSSRIAVRYNYQVGTAMTMIINQVTTNREKTITFESPANVAIFFMGGDTYSNATFSLQIEEGEIATDLALPTGIADYAARNRISAIEGLATEVETIESNVSTINTNLDIIKTPIFNSIITSKNLFSLNPEYIDKEINGITITRKLDGTGFIVNGTCTTGTSIPINGNLEPIANFPAGTYTFKLSGMSGFSTSSRIAVRYNYVVGTVMTVIVSQTTTNREKTITFESPVNLGLFFQNGDTYSNATFSLQIEEGEIATDLALPTGIADYEARKKIDTVEENIAESTEYVNAVTDQISNEMSIASYDIIDDQYENIKYYNVTGDIASINGELAEQINFDYGVRFHDMPYSIKITTSAETYCDCTIIVKTPIPAMGMQEVVSFIYIEDATKATRVRVDLLDVGMNRTTLEGALHNGWNKLRIGTYGAGTINFDGTNTRYRLRIYCNAVTNVWIGKVVIVKPDKANIIFIADHGYKSFYDIAYPAFKNIGVPITWAIDPMAIESEDNKTGSRPTMSLADIDVLAVDGISEFSFHNYDGSTSAEATAVEALYDTVNNIRWLKKKGLNPDKIFRGAWQGNSCPNHELADLEVDASASYDGTTGLVMFPFPDRYNIPRLAMQGRTTDLLDTWFNALKTRHYTLFFYTHGIGDNSQDTSETLLSYYVSKTLEGIQEGWLNPTTYNRLINHYRKIR